MNTECNRCYEASTSPHWVARAVTALREDHPCERHAADHPAQVVPITQPAQPLTDAERTEVIDAGLHDEDILDMLGAVGSRLLDIMAHLVTDATSRALLEAADALDNTTPKSLTNLDIPEWLRDRARGGAA